MNDPERPHDRAVLWREPTLGNIELLRATFVTHAFGRHFHDEFAVGIIEQGTQVFSYRAAPRYATSGSVVVLEPGEVHTGQAATDTGFTYRMFYPDPAWLRRAATQLAGKRTGVPSFPRPILTDAYLARQIQTFHAAVETPSARLTRDVLLLSVLTRLVARHGADRPHPTSVGKEPAAVRLVREYIEAHFADDISLDDLAALANLSPFHMLRVFRNTVGLPPHAYLDQVRIRQAKQLLSHGARIADVAAAAGFADQSHLTRRFKRLVGVTPGQYRHGSKIVQDPEGHP